MFVSLSFIGEPTPPINGQTILVQIGSWSAAAYTVLDRYQLFTFLAWVPPTNWHQILDDSGGGMSIGYKIDNHTGTVKGPVLDEVVVRDPRDSSL